MPKPGMITADEFRKRHRILKRHMHQAIDEATYDGKLSSVIIGGVLHYFERDLLAISREYLEFKE